MHALAPQSSRSTAHSPIAGWQPLIVSSDYSGPSVALSAQARVAIGVSGTPLEAREMAVAGYSLLQAWDAAATNVERRARDAEGIEFLSRPAHYLADFPTGVSARQWNVRGNYIAAWLAHPRTWTRLHQHIATSLGIPQEAAESSQVLRYFCPRDDVLLAVDSRDKTALACTAEWSRTTSSSPLAGPLRYSHGFPVPADWQ